jgi:hypothetical protein
MQGEVIKSFLVGLGFDIDESSLAAFNKNIATAALRVTTLYGAVNAFAGGIVLAFSKISEGFEQMGQEYHIIAPMINKALYLRQELLKAYGAAGINIRKVIGDSINLNLSLTKTKFALEAIYKSVGSKFFGLLQKQSDTFRKRLYENMPYIINILTKLVKGVFKAFELVTQLGARLWSILTRVYDFFIMLDEATSGWSTKILAVISAWKLLNLEFLATPLGMILAGLLAILALYDDYKVWKEGGKSFFNWAPVVPIIDAVANSIEYISDLLDTMARITANVFSALENLFSGNFEAAMNSFNRVLDSTLTILKSIWSVVTDIVGAFGTLGGAVLDSAADKFKNLFGGGASPSGQLTNPLGSGSGGNTNVNANMQTTVNVTGSPNAAATGQAVAASQAGVNRDTVRYFRGIK